MSFIEDLKLKYQRFSVADKLIVITGSIYVLQIIFQYVIPGFFNWLQLSSSLQETLFKPWSVFTYGFLHNVGNPLHILLNMIVLHFVGTYFVNLFNGKRFLNTYFLGILAGALFFLIGAQIHPALTNMSYPLVGASAAIRAVIIFLVAYSPEMEINILGFKVKWKYIGLVLVGIDLLSLRTDNAGGALAHLGGAALGYIYASQLKKGKDIASGFEGMMDTLANWFKKKEKSPLKTVYKNKTATKKEHKTIYQKKREQQVKVDAILDKISKSGYESLSKEEKDFLFQAGKD